MVNKMRLLIGYDGSEFAKATLDDLSRAGLPRDADAVILTVSELWLPYLASASGRVTPGLRVRAQTSAEPVTEARALALEAKRRVQAHFPDWVTEAEEASGSPAREILKKAAEWKPDLIAVGSQGRSGVGRLVLGSVSLKVANEAQCSVRVSRGNPWKNGHRVRILIALDGSPGSEAAVEVVSQRMWPWGSEVRLVTVIDSANVPPRVAKLIPDSVSTVSSAACRAWAEEFIEVAARKLRALRFDVSTTIEEGDPKRLIIVDAEEWGAECIFLGASDTRNPIKKLLLGSVATAIVSRAPCSVEIVRS